MAVYIAESLSCVARSAPYFQRDSRCRAEESGQRPPPPPAIIIKSECERYMAIYLA